MVKYKVHREGCKKVFLPVFLCCISAMQLSAESIDYKRLSVIMATSIALEKNPKIIQYNERFLEKKCEHRSSIGNFLPLVTVNAGYTAMNDPLTMDLDPIRSALINLQSSTLTKIAIDSMVRVNGGAVPSALVTAFRQQYGSAAVAALEAQIPSFVTTLKERQYPGGNIMVVQPLFMGGKLVAAKKAAEADERGAGYDRIRVGNEVTQETFNNYYAVALLKDVVKVREDVLSGMLEHEKDACGLFEAGVIPRTGLLRAEVAVAEARRNLADDESRLVLAMLMLVKSMNLPDTLTVDITDTLSVFSLTGSCDDYIAEADSSQPLLGYLRTRLVAARSKVAAEQAAMLPRITAFGKYELFPDDLSALEPEWAAGVTVSMDLFSGGKRYMQRASATHQVASVQALLENTSRDIHLWVRKAYIECTNANTRYNKLLADESLAMENLRQCRSRFESGYGTAIEVIDAELALEKNRIEKITALYDFHRSIMDLHTATGKSQTAIALMSGTKEHLQ